MGGHADFESRPLASNDWAIAIRLKQGLLQAPAAGTSAVAGFAKLAGITGFRKSPYLFKGWGVQDVDACRR